MKKVLITLAALLCCTIITTSAQDVDPDRYQRALQCAPFPL